MGSIKLQDTGYISPTNEGTIATNANKANLGASISLKTAKFTPSLSRNLQTAPELSMNTPAKINVGSLENMKFELKCVLNKDIQADDNYIPGLFDMIRTNGYKLMWYDYSATGEDNNGQLIYNIALNSYFGHQLTNAEKTAFSISNNFYHLHVLFLDIQEVQSGSKNLIEYSLKGVVLKVETSVLS